MNKEQYKKELQEIENKANVAKSKLKSRYALSNSTIKPGDMIEDHIGKGEVVRVRITDSLSDYPYCVYDCINYTKKGKPSKRETKRVFIKAI